MLCPPRAFEPNLDRAGYLLTLGRVKASPAAIWDAVDDRPREARISYGARITNRLGRRVVRLLFLV
jgi:hypothetical protein